MSTRIVEPPELVPVFDRPGRTWTAAEHARAREWLAGQSAALAGQARQVVWNLDEDGAVEYWHRFYLERLAYTIEKYDPASGRRFWSWLVYCFRQHCHDFGIREARIDEQHGYSLDEEPEVAPELPADTPPVEEVVALHAEIEDLRRAVARLGRREQELLRLRFGEELSFPEIAARMGAPLGSVKVWTFRALHRLRAQLEGWKSHE